MEIISRVGSGRSAQGRVGVTLPAACRSSLTGKFSQEPLPSTTPILRAAPRDRISGTRQDEEGEEKAERKVRARTQTVNQRLMAQIEQQVRLPPRPVARRADGFSSRAGRVLRATRRCARLRRRRSR